MLHITAFDGSFVLFLSSCRMKAVEDASGQHVLHCRLILISPPCANPRPFFLIVTSEVEVKKARLIFQTFGCTFTRTVARWLEFED
jgi:hypothetical protein